MAMEVDHDALHNGVDYRGRVAACQDFRISVLLDRMKSHARKDRMPKKSPYQKPMQAWDKLAHLAAFTTLANMDLNLFYFESGDPLLPAVVCIHGLGDEADTWRHVIEPLAEQYHVLALDLPGFGRSSQPADLTYTPQFFQTTILSFLDQLGVRQAVLIGSSLGGILAHAIAIDNPDRVMGLALVGGALLQPQSMGDMSLRLMALPGLGEWFYTRLRHSPQAAFDSLRNVYHDLDGLPAEDRAFLFTRVNQRVWSNAQRRAYFSTLRNLGKFIKQSQRGLDEKLARLTVPTIVMRGEHDPLFAAENARALMELQPNATYVEIDGAGHLPHQERPEEFTAQLKQWLAKLGS